MKAEARMGAGKGAQGVTGRRACTGPAKGLAGWGPCKQARAHGRKLRTDEGQAKGALDGKEHHGVLQNGCGGTRCGQPEQLSYDCSFPCGEQLLQ